ncbi:DNA polymerase I [Candidatus Aerophobetes bacterium]|nr:DNA polymerase I [Candidatus Aerophobetes bacterium]
MEEKEKLILIDGSALLYRAFYALPPLTTSKGITTGAVYGFTRMLTKLIREKKADYLVCAFDKGRKTFRHKESKDYKATRPKMPEELISQISLVRKVLEGFRIPIFEDEEYEADDLLGTLAKYGEKRGMRVEIFSGDKDILQVVSPSTFVIRPTRGITQTKLFDEEKVEEEFGVPPPKIPDYLALVGDKSDNIPGVPGIGPQIAKQLIKKFGSLEDILENLRNLPPKIRKLLDSFGEQAQFSKKLATIITSIPLEIEIEDLKLKEPQKEILLPLFRELEFKELIKQFNLSPLPEERESEEEIISLKGFKDLVLKEGIFTLQIEKEEVAFFIKDHFYKVSLEGEKNYLKEMVSVLENFKIKKKGYNLKKTILEFKKEGINLKGIYFDIQIAGYLLNPLSTNYSLENLSLDYLGKEIPQNLSLLKKVKIIDSISLILEKKLKEENLWDLFLKVEMPLVKVLARMEERGIKVDKKILKDFLKEVDEKRKSLEKEIYKEVGEEFNINSSRQLSEILFGKMNLPPLKKIKTGYSTDEEVLQTLSLLNPFVQKILEHRRLSKLESTYLKPLINLVDPMTERIYTSFNQVATATGRLSSSKPNLQNIPIRDKLGQKLRFAFIAEDNHLLLSADYSQIELRILAHLSEDNNLKSAFLRGEDIHVRTAAEIFNVLPLEVTPRMRRRAKVVNFGIIYGMSSYGLSRDLGITEKEAEDYIQSYFERYPKVKEYIQKVLEEARKKRYVTTLLGRKRALPGISSSNKRKRELAQRIAINTPIQGGAADLIKIAMINIDKALEEKGLKGKIILQIHDELILEVPEKEIDITRKLVKEKMERAIKLSIPLVVETKIGKNWGEME